MITCRNAGRCGHCVQLPDASRFCMLHFTAPQHEPSARQRFAFPAGFEPAIPGVKGR